MTEKEILEQYSTPGLRRNNIDEKTPIRVDENGKPIFDKVLPPRAEGGAH